MEGDWRVTYGDESGDLLSVLDELDTNALANGRVGLLGLDSDFFQNNALGMGRSSSGRGFIHVSEGALLVRLVGLVWRFLLTTSTVDRSISTHPSVLAARGAQLAGGLKTTGFVG